MLEEGDILICKKDFLYPGVTAYEFKKYVTYIFTGSGRNPNSTQDYYLVRSNIDRNRSMGFGIILFDEIFFIKITDKIKKYKDVRSR